jgi:hypothetical protein
MSLIPRELGDQLDRWLERRTLTGRLRRRLADEPSCDGSLSDVLTVAIARQEMDWALEVWAAAN